MEIAKLFVNLIRNMQITRARSQLDIMFNRAMEVGTAGDKHRMSIGELPQPPACSICIIWVIALNPMKPETFKV